MPAPRSSPEELKNVLRYERRSLEDEGTQGARLVRPERHRLWPAILVLAAVVACVVLVLLLR